MLKNENGITLVILVITVIIMLILIAAGITYGTNSISEIKLQKFSYELQQIQGRVDIIHEKMKSEENTKYISLSQIAMGEDIQTSSQAVEILKKKTGKNYDASDAQNDEELYSSSSTMYRYFSKAKLKEQLDIKNPKFDVIINFKTREVISVEGYNYEGKNYYRLQDI